MSFLLLLDIFDFCRNNHDHDDPLWDWNKLVHVCRAWRQTIFDSPLRLNLQIPCTFGTPVKKYLGIWPNLPVVVDYCRSHTDLRTYDGENAIYALEYPDRVVHIGLNSLAKVSHGDTEAISCAEESHHLCPRKIWRRSTNPSR